MVLRKNKFIMQFYVVLTILLAVSSCASSIETVTTKIECFDVMESKVFEKLKEMSGEKICVTGPISIQTHNVYINTVESKIDQLYKDKIFIDVRYRDLIKTGANDGDLIQHTGILSVEKCTGENCYVYYLKTH